MPDSAIDTILKLFNIPALNDMQVAAYKAVREQQEVMLLSPTGTGKTLGFLLPLAEMLKKNGKNPQCLVLVPSRELALQIEYVWKKMITGLKVSACFGGHLLQTEINNLAESPALLVGTPGRIMDHIVRGTFEPGNISILVLDEFDKSLSLGFESEMSFILEQLRGLKKKILVSATTAEIPAFAAVKQPEVLNFIATNSNRQLELKLVRSALKDKIGTLFQLLCQIGGESSLIFCNHRESAERVHHMLGEMGIENAFFHGGLQQIEREQTLARFRNGSVLFLVATDLAARGLDIPDVKHIIHYHLPSTADEFTHRNGRTARQSATGTAYLIMHDDENLPAWLDQEPTELTLQEHMPLPPAPEWATIYISGGKKDKINKTDIVGFFSKVGKLAKNELGTIEVKDHISYAAVAGKCVKSLLKAVQNEKMKNMKFKIALAR